MAAVPTTVGPVAISVRGAAKRYRLYRRQSDRLIEWLTRRPQHQPFWALRDVSFDVPRGQIVGVIGRNGAGKTTLLRLVTGISPPSSGQIDVNYRMSAILELGSGFHPEFSGRENVFLGGAVLGMNEDEMRSKYDAIVAFAELGPYMEMPYKTYSLGMQARLAFSVAISVDPEILIIDEALAAGDNAFIAKCFERIREICASGATVLFVSHNTYLVQRLCQRALWIDSGHLAADGDPAVVCREYEAALRAHETAQREAHRQAELARFSDELSSDGPSAATPNGVARAPSAIWGTGELRLTAVELLGPEGQPTRSFVAGKSLTIRISYDGRAPYDDLNAVILITRADGIAAAGLDCREAGIDLPPLTGPGAFEVVLDPLLLGRGRYYLSPHIYRDRHGIVAPDDVLVYHDRLYEFDVERPGRPYDLALEHPARWSLIESANTTGCPQDSVTAPTE